MAVRPGQLAFMPSGSIDLTLRGRDAYTVGPQGQLIPRQPEAGMRRITPASGITASTAPTPGFGDVIARQAAARLEAANRMQAMRRQQQRQQPPAPSTFGQRVGTALRQPLTSPTGMGLATAALTGLEMAGPQPVPTSTGQILARAGMAGLQAYAGAQEAKRKREAEERKIAADLAYKTADIALKAQKQAGTGPFAGTSLTAQSFNTLLKLSDKMDKGTATSEEQAMYSLAYGNLARPKVETRETDEGTVTVKVPPIDLSRFHTPEGISPEPEVIGEKRANFTDAETNAASFANRMLEATKIFDDLTASGYDPTSIRDFAAANLPRGFQGWALSEQGQQYLAAKKNFITAQLRKESGAAISETEFETEDIKYFPQPGDTPATVEQKRVSRMKAVEGMKGASGAAYDVIFGEGEGDSLPRGSVFIKRVGGVSYYQAPNGKILAVD